MLELALKVAAGGFVILAAWLLISHHCNLSEIESLQKELAIARNDRDKWRASCNEYIAKWIATHNRDPKTGRYSKKEE